MRVHIKKEKNALNMLPAPAFAAFACAFSLAFADFWPLPPPIFFLLNFFSSFLCGFPQKKGCFSRENKQLIEERERESREEGEKKKKKKKREKCPLGLRSDTRRDANRPPLLLLLFLLLLLLLLVADTTRTERNCCTSWLDNAKYLATTPGRDTERAAAIDVIVVVATKGVTIRTEEEGHRGWERGWCEGRERKRWFCLDRLYGSR